ncbi:hypothetical protein LguiB_009628 [Lonicera macranthoides]
MAEANITFAESAAFFSGEDFDLEDLVQNLNLSSIKETLLNMKKLSNVIGDSKIDESDSDESPINDRTFLNRGWVGVQCTVGGTRSKRMLCIPCEISKRKGTRGRIDEESRT